jgi:dihydroxy-acid dehydratase
LQQIGQTVKKIIESKGCFAAEFNTIAIDDGIAMGHSGMLYSLPSREIIADSIEYVCNAHQADALICISNCDKITPGMMMAAMRLNIPAIFVSGGPMEAGEVNTKKIDLVDAMVMGADATVSENMLNVVERNACPTCGSCSGLFTANSMNCLTEALGLSLPGNGTIVATHINRLRLFEKAAERIVEMAHQYYFEGDDSVLPRNVANRESFLNAMSLDIAMGGSTNTILHLLAVANEGRVDFNLDDIQILSEKVPCICKVSPSSNYHIEDVNRAGGVFGIMNELSKAGLLDLSTVRADGFTLGEILSEYNIVKEDVGKMALNIYSSNPGGKPAYKLGEQSSFSESLDVDRVSGCIRSVDHAYYEDGGLAILKGNMAENGCVVKTAGVHNTLFRFLGPAKVYDSQEAACQGILSGEVQAGDAVIIRYEGPRGGPGMQEMLYPTSYLKSRGIDKQCALITDGRFSGGTSGLSVGHVSPEAAAGGVIALIKNGDPIEIDIAKRTIQLCITKEELKNRINTEKEKGVNSYKPENRQRDVSTALKIYALHVSSADKGAIREI